LLEEIMVAGDAQICGGSRGVGEGELGRVQGGARRKKARFL
jgi:hypothetical protein